MSDDDASGVISLYAWRRGEKEATDPPFVLRATVRAFCRAIAKKGRQPPPEIVAPGTCVRAITVEDWLVEMLLMLKPEYLDEKAAEVFRVIEAARDTLVDAGGIVSRGDWLWLPPPLQGGGERRAA
jgi:hypothetical protein